MPTRTFLITLLALLLMLSTTAFSQGLAEYGTTASTSSTVAAKTASSIQKTMTHTGGALENSLSQPQPSKPTPSQPKVIEIGKAEASVPSLQATMASNRQKLETAAAATGGSLHVVSVPAHSSVYIDGLPVAYAPADVRLAAGKHAIELRHPAFRDWQAQISIAAGEAVELHPKLAPEPGQIFVSFD